MPAANVRLDRGKVFLETIKTTAAIIAPMQGRRDRTSVVADIRIVDSCGEIERRSAFIDQDSVHAVR